MEFVLAAVVAAVVAGAVVLLGQRSRPPGRDRDAAGGVGSRAPEPAKPQDASEGGAGPGREPRAEISLAEAGSGERPAGADVSGSPEKVLDESSDGGAGATADATAGARSTASTSRRGSTPAASAAPDHHGAGTEPNPESAPTAKAAAAPSAIAGGSAPSGLAVTDGLEFELRERRAEIARIEERILTKENGLDTRLAELSRREQSFEDRRRNLDAGADRLKEAKREHVRELERIAGLSAGQAKQILLREIEGDLRHERARLIRQAEDEAKRDAHRRARSILAACMQRIASGHAAETTVSVVPLKSDELKGRVIGREGRNIRALETLTGIDFIIDDTPGVVSLSGFDGVRREIARLTLEKLLEDGRIHPARIEDAFYGSRSEIENRIIEVGEQAVFEAGIGVLHPELVKLLGRLHYRTSYGQNVLVHSIECAHLAAMISEELGASADTARRAALLHDIGKAVTHEVQGPHALVGGQFARRHKEPEAVAHAMEAHHNEIDVQTVEAVVVQIADALSGARPGARGESLEQYTKRLRELEEIAGRHAGVDRVYAMQAGREVRVIVRPEDVDDDTAAILSHEIARNLERDLEYPGQIKVTVIRESRATDYAK